MFFGQSGRSRAKVDGIGSKWTVLGQSGRSRVKVNGLGSKWTVLGQCGRSRDKVDGLRSKWTASNKNPTIVFLIFSIKTHGLQFELEILKVFHPWFRMSSVLH